jgi:hypothetical protein
MGEKIKVNKTNALVKVLVLKLTEFHYFEALGYRGCINPDCSYEYRKTEVERR